MERGKKQCIQDLLMIPVLFNLFFNELELGIITEVATFADDIKLFQDVKFRMDCEKLQKDLTKLGKRTTKGNMSLNVSTK